MKLFIPLLLCASPFAASADLKCPSPNIRDVMEHPRVKTLMDILWEASILNTPRREEGMRLYQCRYVVSVNGENVYNYEIEQDFVDISKSEHQYHGVLPDERTSPACRHVAIFHTHPFDARPIIHPVTGEPSNLVENRLSKGDIKVSNDSGIPSVIRYEMGTNTGNGPTDDVVHVPDTLRPPRWSCGETPPQDVPVPQPASTGDPHFFTPDGLAYDFQGVGEFVLLRSEFEGFEIQSRQESWGGLGSQVSVNTGFAFNVDNVKVALAESPVDGSIELYIDEEFQSRPIDYPLNSGGSIIADRDTLDVRWSDGSRAVVQIRSSWMNLSIALSERHAGNVSGLLGNYNGDVTDDIVTESGTNLTTRPNSKELYGIFADSWRVRSDDASHFHYYEGQDFNTFTNRLFPGRVFTVDDLSEQQLRDATAICEEKGVTDAPHLENCILDVGLSGDAAFADDALAAQNQQIAELQIAELQGEIGVPSRICESSIPPDVINYAGRYVGTLTQTSRNDVWNYEAEITQCGREVYGSFNGTLGEAFADRLFEGTVSDGQLDLEATYPHRFDYTPIGASVPCVDFVFTLSGNESTLSGSWAGSNCTSGGEINLIRQ